MLAKFCSLAKRYLQLSHHKSQLFASAATEKKGVMIKCCAHDQHSHSHWWHKSASHKWSTQHQLHTCLSQNQVYWGRVTLKDTKNANNANTTHKPYGQLITRFSGVTSLPFDELTGSPVVNGEVFQLVYCISIAWLHKCGGSADGSGTPYLKHAGTPGQYYRQRSTPGQPL